MDENEEQNEEQNEDNIDDEPKKPSNPLKKAKTTGKTMVNTTINFFKGAVKFFTNPAIPLPIKIGVIAILFIVIIVVVILDVDAEENASAVYKSVNSYVYSDDIDEKLKEHFNLNASLIKFPLSDINAIYDKYKESNEFDSELIYNYDYILGTKEIKDGGSSSSSTVASDLNNLVQKAITMAEKGGIRYGQNERQTASTIAELDAITKTDCSGFIYSLFKTYLNINVGEGTDNMYSKANSSYSENGWTAEIHEIGDGSDLKPGDILYRDNHVGLYIGNGKQVDHGGPGDANPPDSDPWRGPVNRDMANKGYTHYIRYTNPNTTSSNGNVNPNGDEAEGYARAYTDSKGRTYKEYGQSMDRWSNVDYWGGNIATNGCGPTALAIIAQGYGINETPETLAKYMNERFGYTGDSTLSATLTDKMNLKNTIYSSNHKEKMINNLKAGRPVVISVFGTKSGAPESINFSAGNSHIITALDINDQNQVYIANPAATRRHGWVDIDDVITCIDGYIITIDSDK